jgi:hypothetical protein
LEWLTGRFFDYYFFKRAKGLKTVKGNQAILLGGKKNTKRMSMLLFWLKMERTGKPTSRFILDGYLEGSLSSPGWIIERE